MSRKSSFLGEPDWLEIPFQFLPKDIFNQLLDSCFKLAAILEAVDKAKLSSPPDTMLLRQQIVTECEAALAAHEIWHDTFREQSPGRIVYTSSPSYNLVSLDREPQGPVFQTYLQFPDLANAQMAINYWHAPHPVA
jgi:hypothetical protein